ncbi:Protein QUIRKY [Hordeum vulgare]|nr:Protein QUIRKY [Hordeum vulgare]
MAHAVLVLLAWHPDLIVPTLTLHVAAVGIWKYQHRPRTPASHPSVRASMVEAPDREELDEEFDTIPSAKSPEVVRQRYDRARMVGARLQAMVGDVATQAERLRALMSCRDPRATGMFVVLCSVATSLLTEISWVLWWLVPQMNKERLMKMGSQFDSSGKVHGGRLNFRVFHWIAPLLPATLFGIGTMSSSPSSAPCLLSPVALMILVAFEPRLWCGSMAIVPWLSG